MSLDRSHRPARGEYAPFYQPYLDAVPDGDIVKTLREGLEATLFALRAVPEERAEHRYAPGKWTLREVLGHILDTERVFSYRALRIARGDATPLPGIEQDDYVREGRFERRPLGELIEEYEFVRRANLLLFNSFDENELGRQGTASGHGVSVRALVWIVAGHERHHLNTLRDRYL